MRFLVNFYGLYLYVPMVNHHFSPPFGEFLHIFAQAPKIRWFAGLVFVTSWITCQDLPNGYNYTDGVYVCLDGWFGSANAECIVSEESFGRWKDGSFLGQIG